jgi:hypothetical protein
MERALYKLNGREVVLEIWEGYGFWFAADDGRTEPDDVICECRNRRELGFTLIGKGYEFIRSI